MRFEVIFDLFAVLLLTANASAQVHGSDASTTSSPTSVASDESSTIQRLQSKGFTCSAKDGGTQCVGRLPGYPEKVAVLVPAGYQDKGKYVVHLHGFVLGGPRDSSFEAILNDFSFLSRMKEAGVRDSLMVIPASKGKCDTYHSIFTGSGAFNQFMGSVTDATGHTRADHVTLSGHSGAYVPLAAILTNKKPSGYAAQIDKVGLYDATYFGDGSYSNTFSDWVASSPSHQLTSVYRAGAHGTQAGSQAIQKRAPSSRTTVYSTAKLPHGDNHWDLVDDDYANFLKR